MALYICVTNNHGYVPLVVSTSRSFPHSWPITGFVTGVTRRVPLTGTAYPSGAPESIPCYKSDVISLYFCVVFCRSPLVSSNSSYAPNKLFRTLEKRWRSVEMLSEKIRVCPKHTTIRKYILLFTRNDQDLI
jgi:hypothetical protein